uniref:Clp R domain-containing protein n=1 Tax=Zea mays TaxID=4577 RepID=A0A804NZA9_MAIZE
MRAGGCAVQQALAAEAAAVVRQAVALARRRGHAQVTPLHVASAMLSAAGLLRAACLRSHSHPLQCKALELCFNVALNRLPTAAASMFHPHHHAGQQHAPVLSNALVAAFKRAQAHQRRGSVDGAQGQPPQPVLAGKVDIDQLIISILDDPSVSRVMREAGFSSSQVKANVEKAVSASSSPEHQQQNTTIPPTSRAHAAISPGGAASGDAMRVLDCMASGSKRSVVVVGESAATAEVVVKAVMNRVSKGELQQRHERLKNVQFVPLSAASFQRMPREEVEAKAADLRALVRQGCAAGKGVVLVLEDLAYAAEAWAAVSETRRRSSGSGGRDHGQGCYCPVEHAVMEVGSLVSAAAGGGGRGLDRFWLLGFGNNQAYLKSRAGQPSLEAVWELHPIVVPDGGLALSLSDAEQARATRPWPFANGTAATGDSELITLSCAKVAATTPNVPPWLQGYQVQDTTRLASRSTSFQMQDWDPNSNGAAYHTSEITLSFSPQATNSPDASSISGSFAPSLMMSSEPWQFKLMQPCPNYGRGDPFARSSDRQQLLPRPTSPEKSYSVSNSSEGAPAAESPKFTELTAENLKILSNALENRAPRHKDVVTEIASVVLQCRSGMTRKRRRWCCQEKPSAVTWLLFQGAGNDGKKAVSKELARLVFGSYSKFTAISLSEFTHVHSDSSSGEITLKRQRSLDTGRSYVQRLYDAILENPHRVIMIDGVEQLDYESEIGIRNAITNGRIRGCNGDEISLGDTIIVLNCEALRSMSNASSPRLKQRVIEKDGKEGNDMNMENGMESSGFTLDLNACAEDCEGNYEESVSDNARIVNIVDGVFFFQLMEHS